MRCSEEIPSFWGSAPSVQGGLPSTDRSIPAGFEEREVLYDENNFYDLGKLLLPKGALSSGSNTDTTGGEE